MTDVGDLIGQMFMVDFDGPQPSPGVERLIADEGLGGVILFDKNIGTAPPRQIAGLTNALQQIASAAGRPPLLVSADQEGGTVVRLRVGATHFPSAMAFGAAGSEALAAAAAGITARELRAVGIRMNMAPVLDVNSNPANPIIGLRSYGEDPHLVARLGVAAIRAMQASGVLAAAKHFPGHGDTSQDSHLCLPTVARSLARIEAVELLPFRAAIQAGVGAIMTAHIVYPALDPERPATLSPAILSGLLRERLGFAGLIVTDSMAMRAITDGLPPGEAAVQAVLAGADIVLALGPEATQREALDATRRAVAAGRILPERIAASVERIREAKERLGLMDRATVALDEVEDRVGVPPHLAVAEHVAEAAATLVGNHEEQLPLAVRTVAVVAPEGDAETAGRLAAALRDAGREAAVVPASDLGAVEGGAAVAIVLDGTRSAIPQDARARLQHLVRAAASRGPTAIVVAGSPYGLASLPAEAPCVAVYGADAPSLRAAARVLTRSLEPRGRLPVSLTP
jgi:beta-N-acetylhexosaminidase